MKILKGLFTKQCDCCKWIKYDFNDIESRPSKYDRYVVHRLDGKIHLEIWNGNGWAYNEKVITHYMILTSPK